jgi:N-formylglutamate amidohydrolase
MRLGASGFDFPNQASKSDVMAESEEAMGEDHMGAPFSLSLPESLPVPILIAVPHAGRDYPDSITAAMREPAWGPSKLEDRFVDQLGSVVAEATGAALLVAHAPRAVIDLNRAPDDVDWSMISGSTPRRTSHSAANRRARSGLGLVPRRLPGLGEVWRQRLAAEELEQRIETIHRPYHRAVGDTLERLRDRWGAALLIDLHSMPPLTGQGRGGETTEFVVGDRFGASCSGRLSAVALHRLGAMGRLAAHNRPYSGGYGLDHHAAQRRGIHALQIEVCRASYLDARLDQPGPRLPAVARTLATVVRALALEVAELGDPGRLHEAAE